VDSENTQFDIKILYLFDEIILLFKSQVEWNDLEKQVFIEYYEGLINLAKTLNVKKLQASFIFNNSKYLMRFCNLKKVMNEAYVSNTYKYIVPSICYTFDYTFNLINESCNQKQIHERFLSYLLKCILQNDQLSIEYNSTKLGDQEYKIMFSNQPKTIFPLLNRYFASAYFLFNRKYEETPIKSLLNKLQMNTHKIGEEVELDENSLLLLLAEPCLNSMNEYFNELSVSEDKEKYVKMIIFVYKNEYFIYFNLLTSCNSIIM